MCWWAFVTRDKVWLISVPHWYTSPPHPFTFLLLPSTVFTQFQLFFLLSHCFNFVNKLPCSFPWFALPSLRSECRDLFLLCIFYSFTYIHLPLRYIISICSWLVHFHYTTVGSFTSVTILSFLFPFNLAINVSLVWMAVTLNLLYLLPSLLVLLNRFQHLCSLYL